MARYLLGASPIPGHVLPMLRIGADLRRRGHLVELLTSSDFHDLVRSAGLHPVVLPSRTSEPPRVPRVAATVPPPAMIKRWSAGRREMRSQFVAPLATQYRALRSAMHHTSFDAVLVDVAFTGALPLLLADNPRPPVLACGVGPLMLSSRDVPPFGMGWLPQLGVNYDAMTWVVHRLLFRATQSRLNRELRRTGATRSPVFLTDWAALADRLLQLTVPAFEYPRRDLPSNVTFTGPVLADAPAPSRLPTWWGKLPSTRTIVHVTQGTWDNTDLDQIVRPTIDALADRDDILVIATTGGRPSHDIGGPMPANARVTNYLPYSQLLPRVDLMITNGGYGGVHHALSHGVPVIIGGDTADKPEVAARIAYTGVGIDLGTGRPTETAIAAAVRRVLTTDSYRAAAHRLRDAIARSSPLDSIAEALVSATPSASG